VKTNLCEYASKSLRDIETGVGKLPWEKYGSNLLTGHAVSGVKEA
jgi:hypothetical protein